jgi:tRNA-2-methylthio-N6-dimethylallyladenosine synthase
MSLRFPVSVTPGKVVVEIEELSKNGILDVTLLGQNVNSYNDNENSVNFAGLLKKIATESGIPRIRFLSSHPKDLTDDIIEVMAEENNICKHLHLPVQHGSTKILTEMNRKYSKEDYLVLIKKLKTKIPGISLTTDIMVGFPGETEADLDELKDLMEQVRFSEAFTYFYNPREGTKAFDRTDSLSEEVKKSRLAEIIKIQRKISQEVFHERIGAIVEVVVESVSKKSDKEVLGKTDRNENVLFSGNHELVGRVLFVKITSLKGQTFFGEEVVCPGE